VSSTQSHSHIYKMWIPRIVKLSLSLSLLAGSTTALFNNKKKEEEKKKAMDDVQLGFAGIRQAQQDPAMMADLMKSMADPEIMAEAQKMMKDPAFQKQMKEMMGDKTIMQAAEKAKEAFAELSADPAKMAAMTKQVEQMMAGVDTRKDLSQGMRGEARKAAGAAYGIDAPAHGVDRSVDGAKNAMMGFQSLQESLSDPKAMQEAMELMKDPTMMKEVQRMMSDPSFRSQFAAMQQAPEFRDAMLKGAEAMQAQMAANR